MPKFRIEGRVYDVPTAEAAYALHDNYKAGGEVKATDDMSEMDKILAGVGSGMVNVGRQVGNIFGLVDDETIERQKQQDEELLGTGAGKVGRFVGEIAATAPIGAGAGALARGTGMLGARVLPAAVEAATEGAILAGPGDRAGGALTGGAVGGGLGMATKLGSGLVRGSKRTEGAQRLLDEGVDLTPGQMNPGGVMSALEESLPGRLSQSVQDARSGAELDAFRAMANRAMPPGAGAMERGADAQSMLNRVYDEFEDAYGLVKGYSVPAKPDFVRTQLVKRMQGATGSPSTIAGEAKYIDDLLKRGTSTTDDLLKARSDIRSRIRDYRREGTVAAGDSANALKQVEESLTYLLDRSLPKEQAMLLRGVDSQYGKYKTLEDMMARATDAGQPTPFQMAAAGKKGASSQGAYARGEGPFRDITQAGREAFKVKTTPTGMSAGLPLATTGLGYAMGDASGAIGGLLGPALLTKALSGTQAGRRMMQGAYSPQRAFARTLDQIREPLKYGGVLTRAIAAQQAAGD